METKQTAVEWLMNEIFPYVDWYNSKAREEYRRAFDQALQMEKEQSASREALHAAFKAGWIRANATNYNESYFNHYYDNL